MRLIITGTPGTGKTTIARLLGKALGHKVLNEREFALKEGIGIFDPAQNELVVPLEKLETRLNKYLARQGNVIVEGHMLAEIKARPDFAILLRMDHHHHPSPPPSPPSPPSFERLAARLELRGYKEEKILDNVFCEGIDYCKKHCLRNYPKAKIVEVENNKSIKETLHEIIIRLGKKAKPCKKAQ